MVLVNHVLSLCRYVYFVEMNHASLRERSATPYSVKCRKRCCFSPSPPPSPSRSGSPATSIYPDKGGLTSRRDLFWYTSPCFDKAYLTVSYLQVRHTQRPAPPQKKQENAWKHRCCRKCYRRHGRCGRQCRRSPYLQGMHHFTTRKHILSLMSDVFCLNA